MRKGRDAKAVIVARSSSLGRGGGVEDQEDDVGFGHGFAGFCDADGFGFVGGVAKACGVNEFYGDAFEGDAFGDEVAGGAGGGGDDGAVALDQAVEERGLADVGAADDGQGEAVADDAAVGEGLFEGG